MPVPTSKCTCRTINLAKEGHTPEERRCKMLIYEKKRTLEPLIGPPLDLGLKDTHPSAKRIRICTAADMRTTCPPPVCSCPIAAPKLSFAQMMTRLAGIGLKGVIVAAVVYTTYEAGVWGDAKATECLYVDLKNIVKGTDFSCQEDGAPRVDRIMHHGRQTWNHFVTCAFKCVSDLNDKVRGALDPGREDCNPKDRRKR